MARSHYVFFLAFSALAACALFVGAWTAGVILLLTAQVFLTPFLGRALDWRVLLLAVFVPASAMAASIGAVANPVIDQFQGELVRGLVNGALALFWAAATWLGGIIGWRFVEKLNRQTLQEAAERFGNTVIDEVQARYLGSATPDLRDIIQQGVDYIKDGNAGTVKQSKVTDDRLGAYVSAAIKQSMAGTLRVVTK